MYDDLSQTESCCGLCSSEMWFDLLDKQLVGESGHLEHVFSLQLNSLSSCSATMNSFQHEEKLHLTQ